MPLYLYIEIRLVFFLSFFTIKILYKTKHNNFKNLIYKFFYQNQKYCFFIIFFNLFFFNLYLLKLFYIYYYYWKGLNYYFVLNIKRRALKYELKISCLYLQLFHIGKWSFELWSLSIWYLIRISCIGVIWKNKKIVGQPGWWPIYFHNASLTRIQ